jgi:hypothetical protein
MQGKSIPLIVVAIASLGLSLDSAPVFAEAATKPLDKKERKQNFRSAAKTLADLNFGCDEYARCGPGKGFGNGRDRAGGADGPLRAAAGGASALGTRSTGAVETVLPPTGQRVFYTLPGYPDCASTKVVGSGNYLTTPAISVPIGTESVVVDYSVVYAVQPTLGTSGEGGMYTLVKARRAGQSTWETVTLGWGVTSPATPRFSSFNTQRLQGVIDLESLAPGGAPAGAIELQVEQIFASVSGFTASTKSGCTGMLAVSF